jgi:hypothetical protein
VRPSPVTKSPPHNRGERGKEGPLSPSFLAVEAALRRTERLHPANPTIATAPAEHLSLSLSPSLCVCVCECEYECVCVCTTGQPSLWAGPWRCWLRATGSRAPSRRSSARRWQPDAQRDPPQRHEGPLPT